MSGRITPTRPITFFKHNLSGLGDEERTERLVTSFDSLTRQFDTSTEKAQFVVMHRVSPAFIERIRRPHILARLRVSINTRSGSAL